MKYFGIPCMVACTALSALTACGGGGGEGATNAPAASGTYRLGKQSVNDFESRRVTWQIAVTGQETTSGEFWKTDVTTQVGNDGTYTKAAVGDGSNRRRYTEYSADGGRTTVDSGCGYIHTPAFSEVPGTLAAGQSWETSSTRTCANDSSQKTLITAKGAVVGIEQLTVAAGTFSALKTVTTITYKFANSSTLNNETCWRDTVTGIDLKCNVTSVSTPTDTANPVRTQTSTLELGGYAQTSTGRQKINIERFAGPWEVTFKGTADGVCTVKIDRAGSVDGACHNNFGIDFAIAGSVDNQGVARFNLAGEGLSGPAFSGNFESPQKIAGTWKVGSDNGTWSMLRM